MKTQSVFPSYLNRKNIARLLLTVLIFIAIALALNLAIPKKYVSSTKLYINVYDFGDREWLLPDELATAINLTEAYNSYFDEPVILQKAYEALPKDLAEKYTQEQFCNMFASKVVRNTSAIHVSAAADSAEDALILSNFYAEFAADFVQTLTRAGVYTIYDSDAATDIYQTPPMRLFALIGGTLGLLAAILYIVLEKYIDFGVDTAEVFERVFPDIPIIGQIPNVPATGVTRSLQTGENASIEDVLMQNGVFVSYTRGVSMLPLIRQGRDAAVLAELERPLKKHDIVLFVRANGDYVLHRIIKIKDDKYTVRGDHQLVKEQIDEKQILAYAKGIYRDGEYMPIEAFGHKLYILFWVKFTPLRAACLFVRRVIGKIKRVLRINKKAV